MEQERPLPKPTHDSRKARKNRKQNPSYSWCGRCGQPWSVVEGHDTWYTVGRGMFPLCEECWAGLTPFERIPYYSRLMLSHPEGTYTQQEFTALVEAVVRGK